MNLKLLILNTLVGIISGLVSGVTGEPGFALLLPLLLIFHITDNYKVAIGTILICAIAPLSLLSITQFYKNNLMMIYTGLYISFVFIIFNYFGSFLIDYISVVNIEYISIVIYFFVGFFFLFNSYTKIYGNDKNKIKNMFS
jgi:uncharacterized membrane protein YfcA